jgi:hypothetical protein
MRSSTIPPQGSLATIGTTHQLAASFSTIDEIRCPSNLSKAVTVFAALMVNIAIVHAPKPTSYFARFNAG